MGRARLQFKTPLSNLRVQHCAQADPPTVGGLSLALTRRSAKLSAMPGKNMQRIILAVVFPTIFASCSIVSDKDIKHGNDAIPAINGIWAMLPLRNGIANVVEFTQDGKSNVYPFNCKNKSSDGIESSTYTIDNDKKIHLDSNGVIQELSLISINSNKMVLGQKIGDHLLTFSYAKVGRISPLCSLYKEPDEDKFKQTAFKDKDFAHSPWIPKNPNIERYVGRWADEKGEIQIEVNMDSDGRYRVFRQNNENWNYLYNAVSWSGVELHFQSFAYSDKNELFSHPYHKSSGAMIISPDDDPNKIKWSFFVNKKRFDYILSKKLP